MRQLCEEIVQSVEPPLKRRRGRPRRPDHTLEPKSLKTLCEQVLNQQSPRRRGRKRKRPYIQSPLSLKELCKTVIESNKRKRGRRRIVKTFNPPSLQVLCKRALGQEKSDNEKPIRKKRELFRSQRRKKFNKRLLGFADVPSVIKASYRDRLRRRAASNALEQEKSKSKPKVYVKRLEKQSQPLLRKSFLKPLRRIVSSDTDSDELINHPPPVKTYRRKVKSNGNLLDGTEKNVVQETAYRLQYPEENVSNHKSQINIKFTDLLKDIQKVSLPSIEWKIKIILYNQQISQIVFSNKSSPERCVNVYRNTKYYDISFDKTFVHLLGAPLYVNDLQDLNFLLKIVHTIKENDPVLQYIQK